MKTTFKTRLVRGGDQYETNAELDFTDVPQEKILELAARSIIIMVQSEYRAAGKVPADDTVNVAELLSGKRERKTTPESLAAKFAKMSEVEQAHFLEMLERADA